MERFRGSDGVHVLEAEEERGEDGLTSRANVLEVRVEMHPLSLPTELPILFIPSALIPSFYRSLSPPPLLSATTPKMPHPGSPPSSDLTMSFMSSTYT